MLLDAGSCIHIACMVGLDIQTVQQGLVKQASSWHVGVNRCVGCSHEVLCAVQEHVCHGYSFLVASNT